jgi:hypothetical protein
MTGLNGGASKPRILPSSIIRMPSLGKKAKGGCRHDCDLHHRRRPSRVVALGCRAWRSACSLYSGTAVRRPRRATWPAYPLWRGTRFREDGRPHADWYRPAEVEPGRPATRGECRDGSGAARGAHRFAIVGRVADRTLTPDQLERIRAAVAALEPVAGRLAFLQPPFALEHVAAAGTAFGADVLMLDYIQRFTVGDSKDRREQLETAATVLRRFCDAGAAVLVASAVARQRSRSGSTYRGLNLASFRGSSELEYGADAAYLLEPSEGGIVTFRCEKNRYGAVADIVTAFDTTTQTFVLAPSGLSGFDR